MDTAKLALRAGVDAALSGDGNCRMARVATTFIFQCHSRVSTIFCSARSECRLVGCFLWAAKYRTRARQHCAAVVRHRSDHDRILAQQRHGGMAVRAVHFVGHVCNRAQFCNLAIEFLNVLITLAIDRNFC